MYLTNRLGNYIQVLMYEFGNVLHILEVSYFLKYKYLSLLAINTRYYMYTCITILEKPLYIRMNLDLIFGKGNFLLTKYHNSTHTINSLLKKKVASLSSSH